MKCPSIVLINVLLFLSHSIFSQDSSSCYYSTLDDYLNDKCQTGKNIDIVKSRGQSSFKKRKAEDDIYKIKDKNTKRKIKDVVALTVDGSDYFRIKAIAENLKKEDRKKYTFAHADIAHWYVKSIGPYNHIELNGELKIAQIGGAFFLGGLLGLVSRASGYKVRDLVYDKSIGHFRVIEDCEGLTQFLEANGYSKPIECIYDGKELSVKATLEQLISETTEIKEVSQVTKSNTEIILEEIALDQPQPKIELTAVVEKEVVPETGIKIQTDLANKAESKTITMFPHLDFGKEAQTISINNQEIDLDNASIRDLEIVCGDEICVDNGNCIVMNCLQSSGYIVVKKDKITGSYVLEEATVMTYNQNKKIIEKRRKIKKA